MWALASSASAVGVTALLLLMAGSMHDSNHLLLTWGLFAAAIACILAGLAAVRRMVCNAVAQCVAETSRQIDEAVDRTAVRVGDAIAAALREPDEVDHPGVPRIYSGRS